MFLVGRRHSNSDCNVFGMVRKANVPPKAQFFAWPVALGIINTREKIQRRNPKTCLSPSWCVMCRKNEETSTHPFLHCDVASLYGLVYVLQLIFFGQHQPLVSQYLWLTFLLLEKEGKLEHYGSVLS